MHQKQRQTNNMSDTGNVYKTYYMNQMSPAYKVDERVLKSIVSRNVKCLLPEDRVNVVIYYKSARTSNLIMRNNLNAAHDKLKCTNVVYEYKCPSEDCPLPPNSTYIGYTQCTLSRRLTLHLQDGAIQNHSMDCHDKRISRASIVENTSILKKINDVNRLTICESLLIDLRKSRINRQDTGRFKTLNLFS